MSDYYQCVYGACVSKWLYQHFGQFFSIYPGHFPALVTSGALSQGKGAEL